MSEFVTVAGFEEVWRPVARPKAVRPERHASGATAGGAARDRLVRLVRRTPEVMVKVTGRTRDAAHLRAHLDYISRRGELEAEERDGWPYASREDLRELASDWAAAAEADPRRRGDSPVSVSIVLSMPAGTDPLKLRDAARSFAAAAFEDRFDYVFVLHTDTPRPHVHLAVRWLGRAGERLNPKKADLEAWRQGFARALRDRGVAAEATPRRARGVSLKPERMPLRRLRERHEAAIGAPAHRIRSAYLEAGRAAFGGATEPAAWERRLAERQARIRQLYGAQAELLKGSADPDDRKLGVEVERFVLGMPLPDSRRLELARQLRAANRALARDGRADREPGR